MRTLIFDHPQDVTDAQLEALLTQVSAERRDYALKYHFKIDRVLSVMAYRLLCEGLKEDYGIEEQPEFDFVGHDKPTLKNHLDIHFNMSHCKRGVLCAIGDEPVGVDIEEIPSQLDMDVCCHCFNEDEVKDILSSSNPCMCFTRWWTMKEATLKLTGEGLTNNLPVLFTPERISQLCFETHECPEKGFVYTVCTSNPM